jgi:hypothetical protein
MKVVLSLFLVMGIFHFDWSKEDKNAFYKGCYDNLVVKIDPIKADAICSCMLEELVIKFPKKSDMDTLSVSEYNESIEPCFGFCRINSVRL